jgi:hypothetical protein
MAEPGAVEFNREQSGRVGPPQMFLHRIEDERAVVLGHREVFGVAQGFSTFARIAPRYAPQGSYRA